MPGEILNKSEFFFNRELSWIEFNRRVLEEALDKTNPLLLSVRSGARASMPGMMDTILNLGLNDTTVQGLIKKSLGLYVSFF